MSEQQPEDETAETPQSDEPTAESTEADTKPDSDSGQSELEESDPGDIGDDKLPEDLQPKEDNPLARHPGQTGDDDDKIGADNEGGEAENPSSNMAYGTEDSNAPSDEPGDSDNQDEDDDSDDED